jgi:hypothetical protein
MQVALLGRAAQNDEGVRRKRVRAHAASRRARTSRPEIRESRGWDSSGLFRRLLAVWMRRPEKCAGRYRDAETLPRTQARDRVS